jgi:hypothetical protein
LPIILSFAGSAALFLLRRGIEEEDDGTLSVASKSSVKSVERLEGAKAVASTMAVMFVVKLFFSEDDEAVASVMAVLFLVNLLLFEDDEAVAAVTMAVLFRVDLNNPEDNEAVASMRKAAPLVPTCCCLRTMS